MYEIFEKLMKERGLRVADVCKATGLSQSMMSDWKREKYTPKSDKLQKLADFFGVPLETFTNAKKQKVLTATIPHIPMEVIVGKEEMERLNKERMSAISDTLRILHRHLIPVLGRVAAGSPIEAYEDVLEWVEIPDKMASSGEFFALRIQGDSMEPQISSGDNVIVRRQDSAEDGDHVIALINGSDATCKRLKKYKDGIALISNNPAYSPMYFSETEVETTPVVILGVVKELRHKF